MEVFFKTMVVTIAVFSMAFLAFAAIFWLVSFSPAFAISTLIFVLLLDKLFNKIKY